MNLKICPICRSIYPNDYIECEHCNEELIDNEVYKKWNDVQKNNYQKKYKSKYQTSESTIVINKPTSTQPSQSTTPNIPKCPICSSTDLSKITIAHKAGKIALFGIFGMGDNGKTWKCNNCGSKF